MVSWVNKITSLSGFLTIGFRQLNAESNQLPPLLLQPGDVSSDDNPFNLRPSPPYFASSMKATERSDLVSTIFVRLLEHYLTLKDDGSSNPLEWVPSLLLSF